MSLQYNVVHNMDCLEGMKLIPDASIDLIVTDPPYNTGMTSSSMLAKERNEISGLSHFFNDDYEDSEYEILVTASCKEFFRVLKQDTGIYIFINVWKVGLWISQLEKVGFNLVNVIVWDKVIHGLNYQNYAHTYELIIFGKKGSFFPNHKPSDFWRDLWRMQRVVSTLNHETIKPEKLCREIIRHGSKEGDLVLDAFTGSGSIVVSAKQLNRNFIGFEKEKSYIDIINKRLMQETLSKFTTEKEKEVLL